MTSKQSTAARIAGGLLPILVACLLVPVRQSVDRAGLVLVLVMVVVGVAAAGDRLAAAIAAVVSAASFDLFLTRPYGSMRMTSAADVETAVLLLLIGIAVGQIAITGRSAGAAARSAKARLSSLETVSSRIAEGPSGVTLTALVEREVGSVLGGATCRFGRERPPLPQMRGDATIETSVHTFTGTDFALPGEGVAIAVVGDGQIVGWLTVEPEGTVGVSVESRRAAIALAQQLGAALARPATAARVL